MNDTNSLPLPLDSHLTSVPNLLTRPRLTADRAAKVWIKFAPSALLGKGESTSAVIGRNRRLPLQSTASRPLRFDAE